MDIGREIGDEWLDWCVEERCGLGFTGIDLARLDDDPLMIYADNAAGDLFGKRVVPKDKSLDNVELEAEVVEARDNSWLATWADSVISCSMLPEISLRCKQRPLAENVNNAGLVSSRVWSLPVSVKAREWRRRFEGRGRRRKRRMVRQDEDLSRLTETKTGGEGCKKNKDQKEYENQGELVYNRAGLPLIVPSHDLPADLFEI